MITDLANLGPSLRGLPDSGNNKLKESSLLDSPKSEGPKSFDQALKNVDKKEVDDREPRMAREKEPERDEPRAVKKKEEKAAEPNEKKARPTSGSSRTDMMLEFMDSMESEFSIPPARLAGAMTNLSDEELAGSPEESASQVIAQLGLSPEDAQRAQLLYLQMLQKLEKIESAPQPSSQMMAGALALPATTMASEKDRRMMLNQSLDQMNGRFFMNSPAMKPGPTQATSVTPNVENLDSLREAMSGQRSIAPLQINQDKILRPQLPPLQEADPRSAQLPQGMDPNSMAWKQMEGEQQVLMKKLAALGASAAAVEQGLKSDPQNVQALKAEAAMQNLQVNGQQGDSALQGAGFGLMNQVEGLANEDKNSWDQNGSSLPSLDASLMAQPKIGGDQATNLGAGATFGALMATRNAENAQEAQNVQQLLKQAEYIVKKGGGEAKIQMNPEGLGEIHMKIRVEEGKVNLEMNAETKEAKKLIESSLGDLRSTLGQHKLSIETVKVDVGNQTSQDNRNDSAQQQQRQMDMRQDLSRDQTRQFWSQFNDGNRRGTFFDSPQIRNYQSGHRADPLQPATPIQGSGRYSTSGKGRGLDLVA